MKYLLKKGSTSVILPIFIQDSSSTTGAGLSGLIETSGIVGGYLRPGSLGVALAVDQNVTTEGTYEAPTTAGQARIGTPANMRAGDYEIHLHDDLFATGADSVVISLGGATNMADLRIEIQLTDLDLNDAVRGGMTALPNAAANAAGGLPVSIAGALDLDVKLANTNEITVARMGALTDWTNGGRLDSILDIIAADVVNIDGAAMRGTDGAALASAYTAARAVFLDNLNISGLVASSAEVVAIQNNTRIVAPTPPVMERPDSGSTAYKLHLYLYDTSGNMEAPDALPTITAENHAGVTRSANLGAVTLVSTGHYTVTYTLSVGDAIEQLVFQWSIVEGGVTIKSARMSMVVDTTAVDFTAADRTKLDTLHDTRIPDVISLANINAQVDTALSDVNLDHIVGSATGIPAVPAGTYLDQIMTDGTAAYDRTTDSLQAIHDRPEIHVVPLIPNNIDLANTATYRLGLMLTDATDDVPAIAEITAGTITIKRKAEGGTNWITVLSGVACSVNTGLIYFDETFDSATGYADGDSIQIKFVGQKVTVAGNDHEIAGVLGLTFYTSIRGGKAASVTGSVGDVLKIGGSATAAQQLAKSAATIVSGAAIAGTLSTTQMSTDLTETTTGHYNGRVIIWTSGVLKDQATDITAYDGTTKVLTYTATTEAPSATDAFVIV